MDGGRMTWIVCSICHWKVCVPEGTTTIDPKDCACGAESVNPYDGTKRYKEESK